MSDEPRKMSRKKDAIALANDLCIQILNDPNTDDETKLKAARLVTTAKTIEKPKEKVPISSFTRMALGLLARVKLNNSEGDFEKILKTMHRYCPVCEKIGCRPDYEFTDDKDLVVCE